MKPTNNAFNWQGPSKFTTDKDRANFIGANHDRSVAANAKPRRSPVALPGGSVNIAPHIMRRPI